MLAELYPIAECPTGLLAIMPRPRAGDWLLDEILSWRRQGLAIVVSLLEDGEIEELGLEVEASHCKSAGLRFIRFPIPDRGVPDSAGAVAELVSNLIGELKASRGVGVHCRVGLGRSALLVACILAGMGIPEDVAWPAIERARGLSVPDTQAQRTWVDEWIAAFQSKSNKDDCQST